MAARLAWFTCYRDSTRIALGGPGGSWASPTALGALWLGDRLGRPGQPFRHSLDDDVKDGDQKDPQDGRGGHASKDGRSQGAARGRAGSTGDNQRNDTQDKREGGHQDRAETKPGRLNRRVDNREPFFVPRLGEFHNQNGHLG